MVLNLLKKPAKKVKYKWQYCQHYELHNFVFIHINKTAGRSIGKALGTPFEHKTANRKIEELGKEEWDRRFTFTFVRNPWDRVVSLYHFRVKTNQSNLKTYPMDFKDWVKFCYLEKDLRYYDNHKMFMPQLDWITDAEDELLVDYIGRFSNLNDDFNKVCSHIGKKSRLKHLHRSTRKNYRHYYDDETAIIIQNYYEKDIEFFKYHF